MSKNINILFIGEKPYKKNDAGNKARLDIDFILQENQYNKIVELEEIKFENIIEKIRYLLRKNTLKTMYKLFKLKDKKVILQYPFYFNFIIRYLLNNIIINNESILFIHDINFFRDSKIKDKKEIINIFNKAQYIIIHNEKMKKKLLNMGIKSKIIVLEVFDYILKQPLPEINYQLGNTIVFAGNLFKSEFLQKEQIENLGLMFNLYGPNFDNKKIKAKNIKYNGSYGPDVISYKLEGNFGLIWDGISLTECSGDYGAYLKVNNPHKLSLYISAGIPVITWKKAAIADFIEKYNIGFVVDSLYDIANVIDNMTDEQYNMYINNIKVLQKKVSEGYFTKKALNKVEALL